jgi:Arc/MetJ-type ribon-helix-helix transcriptional regulator
MKENNKRISIRLPSEQREQLEQLVKKGKFKSLSHAVRAVLSKLIEEKA